MIKSNYSTIWRLKITYFLKNSEDEGLFVIQLKNCDNNKNNIE